MKFGVVFPQTEISESPIAVRDFAQAAEELGYAYLLAYDHVLGANPERPSWADGYHPYNHQHMFHEVFVLFGYLAGLTKSIQLTTGVLVAPQRQTALIAKQAAEVDILSNGRMRLGIGIGWNDVEYEAMGINFHKRGKRIEEQVQMFRELWTKPLVTYKGEGEFINDAGLNPLPVQQPIPIWMGGSADAVLRRMARMADGWFIPGFDFEKTASLVDTIRQYLQETGRNPDQFGLEQRLYLGREPKIKWAKWVKERESLGIGEVAVYPDGKTPRELISSIREFHQEIMAHQPE